MACSAVYVLFHSSVRDASKVGLHSLDAVPRSWVEAFQLPASVVVWWFVLRDGNVTNLACLLVGDCEKMGFLRTLGDELRLLKPASEVDVFGCFLTHFAFHTLASCHLVLALCLSRPARFGRLVSGLP